MKWITNGCAKTNACFASSFLHWSLPSLVLTWFLSSGSKFHPKSHIVLIQLSRWGLIHPHALFQSQPLGTHVTMELEASHPKTLSSWALTYFLMLTTTMCTPHHAALTLLHLIQLDKKGSHVVRHQSLKGIVEVYKIQWEFILTLIRLMFW